MSVDMQLQGIDELIKSLEEMGNKANKLITIALEEAADPIMRDIQNTTAFEDRTGNLRKSLKKSSVKNNKGTKVIWIGDVERKATYSWVIEYGTSRSAARPFLRPAYVKNKQQAQEILKEKLREGLRK